MIRPLRFARRFGPIGLAVFLMVPVGASAAFLVWARITTLRLGYELAETQSAVERLEDANRLLRSENQVERSPERLRRIATERFGLRPPRASDVGLPPAGGAR